MKKSVLITGIGGQDGSYLAEFLLDKGYEVYGTVKRNSVSENQTYRLENVYERIKDNLIYADLSDLSSILHAIKESNPDEIYNLAAQSHVRVSFDQPIYTANVTGIGTLNLLEAVRIHNPKIKIYQASSSEMFGNSIDEDGFQRESTPMNPVSPYGCAKVFSYNICRNYRNSYGMFISNGILFNHETLAGFMPVIIKKNGIISIKPISEVVKYDLNDSLTIDESVKEYQDLKPNQDVKIWDKNGWTDILYASGYPHDIENDNKNPIILNSKKTLYLATGSHQCIMEDGSDKEFQDIKIGESVSLVESLPHNNSISDIDEKEAEFLGFIIADGHYKKGQNKIVITQKNIDVLEYYENISIDLYNIKANRILTKSGFTGEKNINQFIFNNKEFIKKYKIYNEYKEKIIPDQILNSTEEIKKSFLKGYYKGDGLKKNKTIYEFKSFKTNSASLASGLIFLFKEIYNLEYNINYFFKNGKIQYQINLLSDTERSLKKSKEKEEKIKKYLEEGKSQRWISKNTGISRNFISKIKKGYTPNGKHHFEIKENEIKKIDSIRDYSGWFYDIETSSGTFHAGVGEGHIHNSPRRGTTFVTNKVVKCAVEIKKGIRSKLPMGNLDARRDWGHAKDYVEAMWLIMQQSNSDDFVCATGISHSVKDLVQYVFGKLDLDWKEYVIEDQKYLRPEELDDLRGDSSKLRGITGWSPKYDFHSMLDEMIEYWMKRI